MPVLSSTRTLPTPVVSTYFSTNNYSASRYSSGSTGGTSNRYTSSISSSSPLSTSNYRSSIARNYTSSYRSGTTAGDDSGIASTATSSSRYGVSNSTQYTRASLGKPPTGSRFRSESRTRDPSLERGYNSYTSSSSKSESVPYQNTKRQSSSSLASSIATSGADLYEKYSPKNYTPKSELLRSRSLSEASPTTAITSSGLTDKSRYRSSSKDRVVDSSTSAIINQVKTSGPLQSQTLLTNTCYLNNNNLSDTALAVTNHKTTNKLHALATGGTAARPPRPACSASATIGGTTSNSRRSPISSTSVIKDRITNNASAVNGSMTNNNNNDKLDILRRAAVTPKVDKNFLGAELELVKNQLSNNNNNKNKEFLAKSTVTFGQTTNGQSKPSIKPLVHQTKLNSTAQTNLYKDDLKNNNMNCLDKNTAELLDDIKYIDSDEGGDHRKNSPTTTSVGDYFRNGNNNNNSGNSVTISTLPVAITKKTIDADTNKYNTINNPKSCHQNSIQINISKDLSPPPTLQTLQTLQTSTLLEKQSQSTVSPSSIVTFQVSSSSPSPPQQPPPSSSSIQSSLATETTTTAAIANDASTEMLPNKKEPSVERTKPIESNGSVRNTSLRNGLPPTSSSRYWDRDRSIIGNSSIGTRTYPDSDSYTTKSIASSSISSRSSADESDGLCGLRNIGNTCFMNSVIQCLSHTNDLCQYLKTKTDGKSITKDQRILSEFAKLLRDMWTPNTRSVTPSELKSAFSSKHRMYSGYAQQDAQEFLRFFLDSLHSACNSGVKGELLNIDDNLSDNKKADLTWEWYTKVENSVIKDLFVGQLKSSLKCTVCGNTSVTFDPFWDLSVPLPSSSKCKLESCLDLFIKEEILDGDEMPTCSKCKTRRKSTKTFTIQRFPKYLVIHLKRFSETRWSKLSNIVEFPTGEREFNMAPYAADSSRSANYSLYGISNHMGSTAGGHYVALCKHPVTKKWHEFNDNIVNDASESNLVSSSAYLLFYERSQHFKNHKTNSTHQRHINITVRNNIQCYTTIGNNENNNINNNNCSLSNQYDESINSRNFVNSLDKRQNSNYSPKTILQHNINYAEFMFHSIVGIVFYLMCVFCYFVIYY